MTQWTEERRKKQAEAIRRWKPWEKSTGPKTEKGKEASRLNAYKHGAYEAGSAEIREVLRLNAAFVSALLRYEDAYADARARRNELLERRSKSAK